MIADRKPSGIAQRCGLELRGWRESSHHGDVSVGNLLKTQRGPVWIDFEDVCAGPVAWDVAGLVASARSRGHDARYADELLTGYGDPGVEDLQPFLDAHLLYETIWRNRPR